MISVLGLVLLTTDLSMIFAIIIYGIGYYGGNKLFNHKTKKNRLKKTKDFFNKYSNYSVFLGRLIPFTRTSISFIAGACKQEYYKYVIYSLFGIFLWNFIFISLGFSVFINLDIIIKLYDNYKILILLVLSASIVIMINSFIINKKR